MTGLIIAALTSLSLAWWSRCQLVQAQAQTKFWHDWWLADFDAGAVQRGFERRGFVDPGFDEAQVRAMCGDYVAALDEARKL